MLITFINNMKKIILFLSFFSLLILLTSVVSAATQTNPQPSATAGTVSLTNPLPDTSPQKLIGLVIKAVLGIVGSLALVMFIYGGFLWMTSAGNAEQVQKGKNVLIWATLGLAVIFSAYALVNFVIKGIGA